MGYSDKYSLVKKAAKIDLDADLPIFIHSDTENHRGILSLNSKFLAIA